MTRNEPRDLAVWVPEAHECTFEYDLRYPDDNDIWRCAHPMAAQSDGTDGVDELVGYGETQTIAYANMLEALRAYQEAELERRELAGEDNHPDILELAKARMED